MKKPVFINGFDSWHETHFEVVTHIMNALDNENSLAAIRQDEVGRGGLFDLAQELTDEFEKLHEGAEWGSDENLDWFDTIDEFMGNKLFDTQREKAVISTLVNELNKLSK